MDQCRYILITFLEVFLILFSSKNWGVKLGKEEQITFNHNDTFIMIC